MRWVLFFTLIKWIQVIRASLFAANTPRNDSVESNSAESGNIITCFSLRRDYQREDVGEALRAFNIVHQLEFLNDHGTVLVLYRPGTEVPDRLYEAIHRALAAGLNCTVQADRGKQ